MRDPAVLDAGIRAYLEAENAYTEAAMAPTEGLRKQLFAEMKARIKEDDSSVPSLDGPFAYYQRFETGGQHPVFCRRPAGDREAGAEVLLAGHREAAGERSEERRVGKGCVQYVLISVVALPLQQKNKHNKSKPAQCA